MILTIIKTPQFLGSQERFDFTEQSGTFNPFTCKFKPDYEYHYGRVSPHSVQFKSIRQWLKCRLW